MEQNSPTPAVKSAGTAPASASMGEPVTDIKAALDAAVATVTVAANNAGEVRGRKIR